ARSPCRRVAAGASRLFLEAAGDQVLERRHRLLLVAAVAAERDVLALRGRQHQQAEDALAVDDVAVLDQLDVALEAPGEVHQLGRGARVQPQAVDDLDLVLDHAVSPTTAPSTGVPTRMP